MPYAYQVFTGNGSTTQYAIAFPYIRKEHVKVFVNFVDTSFTFANDTTAQLSAAPGSGVRVEVRRVTPANAPLVDYTDGSTLTAADLDTNALQQLYLDQELDDIQKQVVTISTTTGLPTLGNSRLTDVTDPTNAQDAATKNYVDSRVNQTANIADAAITTAKIADANVTTAKILDANVTTAKVAAAAITTAKIADNNVTTAKIPDANITTAKLADASVTTAKIPDAAITAAKLASGIIDASKLTAGTVVTDSEVASVTPNDTSFFSTQASDTRYFRQDTSETIASGNTWSASDTKIATTAAIDARVVDLVDDVGGFVPIANETSFPVTNPDVNNGPGTIVSIATIGSTRTPNTGVVSISNGSGTNTVTINNCGTTVLTAGFGVLVETTGTLHTYNFHRLVPKATEVTTVAANATAIANVSTNLSDVRNFSDLYQISNGNPSVRADGSSLVEGDLLYDRTLNVLKAYNGSSYQNVAPDSATLADINVVANDLATFDDLGSVADAVTAANSGGALETCADNITDIRNLANIEDGTTATNAITNVNNIRTNVTAVANNITAVSNVSSSLNDINRYVQEYKISNTAPTSPSPGDLWYDGTANILKYYNSANFVSIAPGLTSVSADTSPTLGGNLNAGGFSVSNMGTIDGANLAIDFGTL